MSLITINISKIKAWLHGWDLEYELPPRLSMLPPLREELKVGDNYFADAMDRQKQYSLKDNRIVQIAKPEPPPKATHIEDLEAIEGIRKYFQQHDRPGMPKTPRWETGAYLQTNFGSQVANYISQQLSAFAPRSNW